MIRGGVRRWLATTWAKLALLGRGDWAGITIIVLLVVAALGLAFTRGAGSCTIGLTQIEAALAQSDGNIRSAREADAGARCNAYAARRDILRDADRSVCWAANHARDATTLELAFYAQLADRCETNGGQLGR